MKLEIDFSALDDQMRRMGATETTWRPGEPPLDTGLFGSGHERRVRSVEAKGSSAGGRC